MKKKIGSPRGLNLCCQIIFFRYLDRSWQAYHFNLTYPKKINQKTTFLPPFTNVTQNKPLSAVHTTETFKAWDDHLDLINQK